MHKENRSKALTSASASLEKILNFNNASSESSASQHAQNSTSSPIPQTTPILNSDGDPIWKVLVFDDLGRDVISSVLRVNDLRGWGVTIHLYAVMLNEFANTETCKEHQQSTSPNT